LKYKDLPLFPLNLVLLPFEKLPLYIFEPRYKIMVKNSIKSSDPFGIVLREKEGIHNTGCQVRVTRVIKEYDGGEYDIIVQGTERFSILKTQKNGDTYIGKIDYKPEIQAASSKLIENVQHKYMKVLILSGVNKDIELYMEKKISYDFLQGIQLPLQIKKRLLDIDNEETRMGFINKMFQNVLDGEISSNNIPEA
tara:strand:- start:18 stop:602 length:585 start_codon:yes stop_codon:yes gene_type:complete